MKSTEMLYYTNFDHLRDISVLWQQWKNLEHVGHQPKIVLVLKHQTMKRYAQGKWKFRTLYSQGKSVRFPLNGGGGKGGLESVANI
jgi:hypothetical protein